MVEEKKVDTLHGLVTAKKCIDEDGDPGIKFTLNYDGVDISFTLGFETDKSREAGFEKIGEPEIEQVFGNLLGEMGI